MRSGGTVPRSPDLAGHAFRLAEFSGFAALTEAHGDEQAPTSSAGFCAAVCRLLAEHHADEVRAIGDALLIPAGDPAVAIRRRGARRRLVGATVSLAARVSTAVRQGTQLVRLPIDPVCRMAVDPWHGAGRRTHQGVKYGLSLEGAGAFALPPGTRHQSGDAIGTSTVRLPAGWSTWQWRSVVSARWSSSLTMLGG